MKTVLLLLFFTTLSFGQTAKSRDLMVDKAPCIFEMTIAQLTADKLAFKCPEVYDNKPFDIQNFKIKFMGKASIVIDGNALNEESKAIAKTLQPGNIVSLYDIQKINVLSLDNKTYKTLLIKIVE